MLHIELTGDKSPLAIWTKRMHAAMCLGRVEGLLCVALELFVASGISHCFGACPFCVWWWGATSVGLTMERFLYDIWQGAEFTQSPWFP